MATCIHCSKENRTKAKFCKWCGKALVTVQKSSPVSGSEAALSRLVGKEDLKEQIKKLLRNAVNTLVQGKNRGVEMRRYLCFAITGSPGVGKNTVADVVTEALFAEGIVRKHIPTLVRASDYARFVEKLDDNIKSVEGNVLVIDDAHKHCPVDRADTLCDLESILSHCAEWAPDPSKPVVIFVGDGDLKKFFENNPASKALVKDFIEVPEPDVDALTELCCRRLVDTWKMPDPEPVVREKISRVIMGAKRDKPGTFSNAHFAVSLADAIYDLASESKLKIVTADIVPGKEYVPRTLQDVMTDFDKYVGVDEIKESMMSIVNSIESFKRLHPDKIYQLKDHYIFLGNPGTGKTTMARVFADALCAMGILPTGQLIEVSATDLRGQYVGQTAPKVDAAFDRAMGGVLFIDEAYSLWNGENDSFGNDAVTALIKNVEDRRGKLVVILAGYPREMGIFETANPGIKSRFNQTINFRDYNAAELAEIARRMIRNEGYTVDAGTEGFLDKFFEKMYVSRQKDFGNARDVRNAVQEAIKSQNTRIRKEMQSPDFDLSREFVLTRADFAGERGKEPMTIDQVIATMDDLVGMDHIKQEIRMLANVAHINRLRMERGIGSAALQPVNIILTGNPGTGKTTIAKRLGQVLHAAGVLPSDKVVEREAKSILSSYVNASAKNMDKAVDEAMGGVLFIDEAYNLLPVSGSLNNTGNEALDALMTRMENDKGKFVVVIAGYKDRMEELVRRGNPGLMSRFNKRLHINDYTASDLMKILEINAAKRKLNFTSEALEASRQHIEDMVNNKGLHFGNAREVVTLLEEIIAMQGNRLANDLSLIDSNPDALTTIEKEDIPEYRSR